MTALLPCPFCGSSDVVMLALVDCQVCYGCAPTHEAWNRRAPVVHAHLSDPEWEGITIERAYQRAKEAGTRADAAEARAAALDAEVEQVEQLSKDRYAEQGRAEAAEAALAKLRAKAREVLEVCPNEEGMEREEREESRAAWSALKDAVDGGGK